MQKDRTEARGGVSYRLKDGSDIIVTGFDTMYVITDRGPWYAPDLLDNLVEDQFTAEVEVR